MPGGVNARPVNPNRPGGPRAAPTPVTVAPGSYELQINANRSSSSRRRRHRKYARWHRRVNPGKPGGPRKEGKPEKLKDPGGTV